ncbi:hypothetical protein K461DRAFT_290889 [Myriangium duriaei CBS 260.36]|uniref:Uncharacterized protein n=1 Tax=Myriangium duriaei CBS 260.36 TaxID=1168546 RepID=A0A9P4JBQ2_9PEZI|nr:hypothetical protein K461DRAFT_290889 [Myriangium duriaei CBS 260.36]
MALNEVPLTRRSQLRSRAAAFTSIFSSLPDNPPPTILDKHFGPFPRITEHGPAWAQSRLPFIGKTFSGREECLSYFAQLGEVLEFEPVGGGLPPTGGIVVDPEALGEGEELRNGEGQGVVCVHLKGKFRSKKTGEEWEESFAWRLSGFDEEGRIGWWEIWADPLSAWLAVGGELERTRGS